MSSNSRPSPVGWAAVPIVAFAWRAALALLLCALVMLGLALLVAATTGGCGAAPHVSDALKDLAGRVCVGTDTIHVCLEKCALAAAATDGGAER